MYLKIHKKYLEKVEQYTKFDKHGYHPYAARYIFNLPAGTQYEGYALMMDTTDARFQYGELIPESVGAQRERKGNYYCLFVEDPMKEVFISRYKDREPGKKYKRFSLTYEKLQEIYNFEEGFEDLPMVVAKVSQYLNNGTSRSKEVVQERYAIGRSGKTWFYCGGERRKLGTKGVQVIGEIQQGKEEEVARLIEAYYRRKHELAEEIQRLGEEKHLLARIATDAKKLSREHVRAGICAIVQRAVPDVVMSMDTIIQEQTMQEERFLQSLQPFLV